MKQLFAFLALLLCLSAAPAAFAQDDGLDTLTFFFKPGEYELPIRVTLPTDAEVVSVFAGADRWEAGDALANAALILARARNMAATAGLPSFTLNVLTGDERVAMIVFRHAAPAESKIDLFPWLLLLLAILLFLAAMFLIDRYYQRRHPSAAAAARNSAPGSSRPHPMPGDPDLWGKPSADPLDGEGETEERILLVPIPVFDDDEIPTPEPKKRRRSKKGGKKSKRSKK